MVEITCCSYRTRRTDGRSWVSVLAFFCVSFVQFCLFVFKTGSSCGAQESLESVAVFLPLPLPCWDYRDVSLSLAVHWFRSPWSGWKY